MINQSPLRYPGAKWRLEPFFYELLRRNKLFDATYVEPYAGGGSLAITLLLRGAVSEIHLNDLDRGVYGFWHSIVNHSNEFIRRVRRAPLSIPQWLRQREIYRARNSADLFDVGFAAFYMNRTNRSGMLDGGVIGGLDQRGNYKMDCRFNRVELSRRIEQLSRFRSQIHVSRRDAGKWLAELGAALSKRSLVYLDPPYFNKSRDLYMNWYLPADHAAVARAVTTALSTPWVVSYDDVPEVRRLYRANRRRGYLQRYSAAGPRRGREIFFFSEGLAIPRMERLGGQNQIEVWDARRTNKDAAICARPIER